MLRNIVFMRLLIIDRFIFVFVTFCMCTASACCYILGSILFVGCLRLWISVSCVVFSICLCFLFVCAVRGSSCVLLFLFTCSRLFYIVVCSMCRFAVFVFVS